MEIDIHRCILSVVERCCMIYKTGSLTEFVKEIKNDVYCFGAGRVFTSFLDMFAHFKLETYIKAVVDNNSKITGSFKKVANGANIPIISLQQMLNDIKPNDCILITTIAYEEVIDQLERIEKLKDITFYIYSILSIEQHDFELSRITVPKQLSTCQELQIPKVIHYCWFGRQQIPNQYKKWMESWKYYCPDYEIIEWNEDNYDVHKNKYSSQAYEKKKWAFVSDYARIDIVNEYGGVYLDTDVELIKNIDILLMNEAFCSFETIQYVNYGLGFGAKKNNSILSELKEYYSSANFILEKGKLDQTPCPIIQTEVMKRHELKCNGEFQVVDGMTVYPSSVLCGMSPYSFRVKKDLKDSYAIHHYAGSWVEGRSGKESIISRMKRWSKNDNYIYFEE